MRTIVLPLSLLLAPLATLAQTTWNTNLNNGTDLKLGTSGAQPLNFYTNGNRQMSLSTGGALNLPALAANGIDYGILVVDAQGNLARLPNMVPGSSCGSQLAWTQGGNYAIAGNNSAGTCDAADFILKAGNVKSVFMKPSGFVGIGRLNVYPKATLDVCDSTAVPTVAGHFRIYGDYQGKVESSTDMRLFYSPGYLFEIKEGNVNGPANQIATKLQIAGNEARVNVGFAVLGVTNLGTVANAPAAAKLNINIPTSANPANAIDVYDATTAKVNFRVKSNGVVYAREVNVQLNNFPDYVFARGYKLRSLESLERYIGEHGRLPGAPSAAEVAKEGANLAELSRLQMEKIEELTLYVIELKKEINVINRKLNNQ